MLSIKTIKKSLLILLSVVLFAYGSCVALFGSGVLTEPLRYFGSASGGGLQGLCSTFS